MFYLKADQILDSRGQPTINLLLYTDHYVVSASVPSGKSKSTKEAVELRDNDSKLFNGLSVNKAINNIQSIIYPAIKDLGLGSPEKIDSRLIELDSTPNKAKLGANATLAVSLAVYKAASLENKIPLYQLIGQLARQTSFKIPQPLINVINGGQHGHKTLSFQEFHLIPHKNQPLSQKLNDVFQVFQTLALKINDWDIPWGYGDEGGLVVYLYSNQEALDLLTESITEAGFQPYKDFLIGLDVAANSFYQNQGYMIKEKRNYLTSLQFFQYYQTLLNKYPIKIIEDPFAETDNQGWQLVKKLNSKVDIIADDLTSTNVSILDSFLPHPPFKGVIVKPNQIGTIKETLDFITKAKQSKLITIVSHRSGETTDSFIADLAVGVGADYVKFGNIRQGERVAKYNRLLHIESEIDAKH
ncbi:MAG: phosphopyruvate hydratase [bacterium]|nr:phosphopyruvate hydratase [bacterium]